MCLVRRGTSATVAPSGTCTQAKQQHSEQMAWFSSAQEASACRAKQAVPSLETRTETGILRHHHCLSWGWENLVCTNWKPNVQSTTKITLRDWGHSHLEHVAAKYWHIGARYNILVQGNLKKTLFPLLEGTWQLRALSPPNWSGSEQEQIQHITFTAVSTCAYPSKSYACPHLIHGIRTGLCLLKSGCSHSTDLIWICSTRKVQPSDSGPQGARAINRAWQHVEGWEKR